MKAFLWAVLAVATFGRSHYRFACGCHACDIVREFSECPCGDCDRARARMSERREQWLSRM